MSVSLTPTQIAALANAFRPHAPIEDPQNFVGRETERSRVTEAIFAPGLQVVVFGERGAGKTSLANVATAASNVERVQVFCEKRVTFSRVCLDILLKYSELHPGAIIYDAARNTIATTGITIPVTDITGNMLLRILPSDTQICIILDELDRIEDKNVIADLAELAKNISTYNTNITMIFVGVAATADELLTGHISNFRNLRQVTVDRMTEEELEGVISRGEDVLDLNFAKNIVGDIIQLCDRFPYYLHLLATNSAKSAMSRQSNVVAAEDLTAGIAQAAADADQSLREDYEHASLSVKQSPIYRRILWAMSDLPGAAQSNRTIFDAANNITSQEAGIPVSVQSVGQALVTLASDRKKKILISRTQGFYSFSNPLMKGYVKLVRAKS